MLPPYEPPKLLPVSGLPAGAGPALTQAKTAMINDLLPHAHKVDAVICAGDFHGVALAAVAAARLCKPLGIVCASPHGTVASPLLAIGELPPRARLLYVDDFFCLGASLRHVLDWLARSGDGYELAATYAAQERSYQQLTPPRFCEYGDKPLTAALDVIMSDLLPHAREFEAITCAWDYHGTALAAVAAAWLGKALVIVCTRAHEDVISHIVPIGDFDPCMRLLCMSHEASGPALKATLGYLSQSAPANVVATYEAGEGTYTTLEGT